MAAGDPISYGIKSNRIRTFVGRLCEESRLPMEMRARMNSCCGASRGAPHEQAVRSPLRSLTAATRLSKQAHPLSKARPDVRSPKCSRFLAVAVAGADKREPGWPATPATGLLGLRRRPVASDRDRMWVRLGGKSTYF